jgi:hypothetical protein
MIREGSSTQAELNDWQAHSACAIITLLEPTPTRDQPYLFTVCNRYERWAYTKPDGLGGPTV